MSCLLAWGMICTMIGERAFEGAGEHGDGIFLHLGVSAVELQDIGLLGDLNTYRAMWGFQGLFCFLASATLIFRGKFRESDIVAPFLTFVACFSGLFIAFLATALLRPR